MSHFYYDYESGMFLHFFTTSFKSFDNSDFLANDFLPFCCICHNISAISCRYEYFGAKVSGIFLPNAWMEIRSLNTFFLFPIPQATWFSWISWMYTMLCCWTKIRLWALLRGVLLGSSPLVTVRGKLVEILISRLEDEA